MARQDYRRRVAGRLGSVAFAALLLASAANAHIAVDAPNGGEVIEAGSTVSVIWHVLVEHEMLNWDVTYSTTGSFGQFTPVATGLPEGDSTVGSVHTFDWTVPDTVSAMVRIGVSQVLPVGGYEDISDQDFAIVPLQSVGRLRVLSLDRPIPDLGVVFKDAPCTRVSDLRICAEAPGNLKNYNDPLLPITIPGTGDLVLIEIDSHLAAPGTVEQIAISKGPSGTVIVDSFP